MLKFKNTYSTIELLILVTICSNNVKTKKRKLIHEQQQQPKNSEKKLGTLKSESHLDENRQ